jgi:hypothetical protein
MFFSRKNTNKKENKQYSYFPFSATKKTIFILRSTKNPSKK